MVPALLQRDVIASLSIFAGLSEDVLRCLDSVFVTQHAARSRRLRTLRRTEFPSARDRRRLRSSRTVDVSDGRLRIVRARIQQAQNWLRALLPSRWNAAWPMLFCGSRGRANTRRAEIRSAVAPQGNREHLMGGDLRPVVLAQLHGRRRSRLRPRHGRCLHQRHAEQRPSVQYRDPWQLSSAQQCLRGWAARL